MKKTVEMRESCTWVMFGSCNEGDDVLALWNANTEPSKSEQQDVILRLPLYVYRGFRVAAFGPKSRIPNHRTKAGRIKDVPPLLEEHS